MKQWHQRKLWTSASENVATPLVSEIKFPTQTDWYDNIISIVPSDQEYIPSFWDPRYVILSVTHFGLAESYFVIICLKWNKITFFTWLFFVQNQKNYESYSRVCSTLIYPLPTWSKRFLLYILKREVTLISLRYLPVWVACFAESGLVIRTSFKLFLK